jgi:hypothetical protein
MKLAILCLPRYEHLKQLILRQLATLEHTFYVVEELAREFIDGGLAKLVYPANVVPVMLERLDHEGLLRLVREHGIGQVISFSDRGVVLAARLREQLGMGGTDSRTEAWVVDKGLMRRRLHEAGLSRIRFVVTTLERLAEDVRDQPLPVVVKPTSLGASFCVELIERHDQLPAYVRRCRANRVFKDGNVIVEQYMPGRELSVEGIVARGEIGLLGVTESHTSGEPYFVGTGHDFFTRHEDAATLEAFVTEVIRCLELDDCPFHIELKYVEHGYEILEVHTRFGGAMIMELVEHATGIPVFSHYVETLLGAPLRRPRHAEGLIHSQHLLCTTDGVVERIHLDPAVTADERVLSFALDYADGDVIEADVVPVQYAGYITFTARTRDEANRFRALADQGFTMELRPWTTT